MATLVAFLLTALALRGPRLRRSLGAAAAILVAIQMVLLVLGLQFPAVQRLAFELHTHHHLSTAPRFTGIAGNPFSLGFLMLACAGLIPLRFSGRLGRALSWSALALTVASLSFATLLAPIVVVWHWIRPRALRWTLTVAVFAGALAILWIAPLEVHIGEHALPVSPLHPSYHKDGNGPRFSPIRQAGWDGLELEFYPTGYYYLANRGLRCFIEHPLVGVGGRNFPYSCPVMTMTGIGQWTSHRIAHNEYTGLLAEHGIIGLLATILFLVALLRAFRISASRWQLGVVVAYLLCGFAGEVWYQFPFAALVAALLEPRRADDDASVAPEDSPPHPAD